MSPLPKGWRFLGRLNLESDINFRRGFPFDACRGSGLIDCASNYWNARKMSKSDFPKIELSNILTAKHLPAMSQTAIRLMEISNDPTKGPADYAVPIELDPGLTVQVLNFVNSSWFGFRDKIATVKRATSLVGIRTIKNFVLWNAVFNMISKPTCGTFCLVGLWQDSLRRALFARAFTRMMGITETDEVFTAALLQDMAVPLLAKELPDAYTKLFDARAKSSYRLRLSELEVYAFGWHHASAAKMVAKQWNLPETLAESHRSPFEPRREGTDRASGSQKCGDGHVGAAAGRR